MGKFLKLLGLASGGLLAFGSGAVGSHYAQPYLEKKFYPERIQRELRLRQSFATKQEEFEFLAKETSEQEKINVLQGQSISSLKESVDDLKKKVDSKGRELSQKEREIGLKDNEIEEKNRIHQRQLQSIKDLNGKIEQKDNELKTESENKRKIEEQFNYRKQRLALTKEHILTKKTLDLDLLEIDTEKIEFKNFDGIWAEFEVTERGGNKVKIKVNKENPTNHEHVVEEIRKNGIPYEINSNDFKQWDKKIKLVRFDAYYDQNVNSKDRQRHYVKQDNKDQLTITLTDYFREPYLQEAFKVYTAITKIDYFSLRYDWSQHGKKQFYFCSDSQIWDGVIKEEKMYWRGFTATADDEKFSTWTNRFMDTDSFIRYWADKTVEFTRTGTVDFSGLLNPVNKLSYYK